MSSAGDNRSRFHFLTLILLSLPGSWSRLCPGAGRRNPWLWQNSQGVKGAKDEASIYDNNLLVLSLQLFHSPFPLTHLLFYIYFAFSLSASLSQSRFPFPLFCLACISLSCHKSTLLEAPKGFFPMASLCELCLFFLFNLQCSTLHCHWFNRPPWILLPVKQQHNYFEFYCGRAWHPALDHLTLFTLARVHLKIQDNVMCDSRVVFCGIVLFQHFRNWMIWQMVDKDGPTHLIWKWHMECGSYYRVLKTQTNSVLPSHCSHLWMSEIGRKPVGSLGMGWSQKLPKQDAGSSLAGH